ncbi:MAG: DUF3306 domain-containing protein [Gammaproteobacteria bacterium]
MSESDRQRYSPAEGERREEGAVDEPFLKRWSRLKADSALRPEAAAVPAPLPEGGAAPAPAETQAESEPETLPPGDEDMPPIETLGEDSDFSGFMSPRVSADLRKQALRKLFRSPKFNVISELDDYIDDYRNFPALGDIVTSDMKHAAARFIEKQLREAEAAEAAEAAGAAGAEEAGRTADAPDGDPASTLAADTAPGEKTTPSDPETSDPDDTEEPARDA